MLFFKPTLKSFLRGRESQEKERERNLQVEMGGKMCQKDLESERKGDGAERASGRDPSVEEHQEGLQVMEEGRGEGGRVGQGNQRGTQKHRENLSLGRIPTPTSRATLTLLSAPAACPPTTAHPGQWEGNLTWGSDRPSVVCWSRLVLAAVSLQEAMVKHLGILQASCW